MSEPLEASFWYGTFIAFYVLISTYDPFPRSFFKKGTSGAALGINLTFRLLILLFMLGVFGAAAAYFGHAKKSESDTLFFDSSGTYVASISWERTLERFYYAFSRYSAFAVASFIIHLIKFLALYDHIYDPKGEATQDEKRLKVETLTAEAILLTSGIHDEDLEYLVEQGKPHHNRDGYEQGFAWMVMLLMACEFVIQTVWSLGAMLPDTGEMVRSGPWKEMNIATRAFVATCFAVYCMVMSGTGKRFSVLKTDNVHGSLGDDGSFARGDLSRANGSLFLFGIPFVLVLAIVSVDACDMFMYFNDVPRSMFYVVAVLILPLYLCAWNKTYSAFMELYIHAGFAFWTAFHFFMAIKAGVSSYTEAETAGFKPSKNSFWFFLTNWHWTATHDENNTKAILYNLSTIGVMSSIIAVTGILIYAFVYADYKVNKYAVDGLFARGRRLVRRIGNAMNLNDEKRDRSDSDYNSDDNSTNA